jgi:PPOX class probable F420-dependent enzyme
MKDVQLKPMSDAVRAFLDELRFAVLATRNSDGSISQSVMWFVIDDDTLLMNTARGRVKANNLEADGDLSICVEDGYRFVTLTGKASLVYDQDRAHADIYRLAQRYMGADGVDAMYERSFRGQERISIVMPISRIVAHGFGE